MRALLASALVALAPARAQAQEPAAAGAGVSPAAPTWTVPLLHDAGLLAVMRVGLSLRYPGAFDPLDWQHTLPQFRRSWSEAPDFRAGAPLLESDGDPWTINTVGHGLFGSEVYLRARTCGHAPLPSALSALAVSTFWEYVPEAFHKQPSAIDLVWTPTVGSLLGEARFQAFRALGGEGVVSWPRRLALVLIDPFGEAERAWLGTGC